VLPEDGELRSDLLEADVEVLIRPLAVLRRGLMTPRGLASVLALAARDAAGLGALIRRRRIALVHSNTSVVLGGAAAAAVSRVPHVWHVREIFTGFDRLWPTYRRLLGTAAALPCVSDATASQFPRTDSARVIYDGLALDAQRAPRDSARRALALDDRAQVIAVLGRVSSWKGQDVLIRALAEPALRERGAVGLIAGDVWPGAEDRLTELRRLADGLGVADRVRMLGFREDVENVYGAADLIAVPSTAPDPLPGAAIEAAAAGCAVIASDHGGLPEIVRDRHSGRLIAPGNPAALAEACAGLLDDPSERERLGAAAALDARLRFDPARLLAALHELYDSLPARRS
jgi:glycosyltransferase involved in cell wall biosynthesis